VFCGVGIVRWSGRRTPSAARLDPRAEPSTWTSGRWSTVWVSFTTEVTTVTLSSSVPLWWV